MLLGMWCPSADRRSELVARMDAICRGNGTMFEACEGSVALRVTAPAKFDKRGDEAVGWQHASPLSRAVGTQGPELLVGKVGLKATAGALPQYPLYYYRQSRPEPLLVVSSELTSLLRLTGVHDLELSWLAGFLCDLCPRDGSTPFREVKRLRAGESVHADGSGLHWARTLPRAGQQYLRDPPEELALEVRRLIAKSVASATARARRVAVFVGGGLDSSGVLATLMPQVAGAQLHVDAIAETWAGPGDDRPYLAELERALKVNAIRLPARDAARWLMPSLCMDAQPQHSALACGDLLLWAEAHQRGATEALAGHAGDVVFGGEPDFAALALEGHPWKALSSALRLQVPWHLGPWDRTSQWVLRPLLRRAAPRRSIRARRWLALKQPWMTATCKALLRPLVSGDPEVQPTTPDGWMNYFCEHPVLANLCTTWGQMAAATAIAPVDVLRDPDLVRFVCQVNPLVRSHGQIHRGLYRLAMQGLLPERVRLRRDKAVGEPLVGEAAAAGGAREALRPLSHLTELGDVGLVVPEKLEQSLSDWIEDLCGSGPPVVPDSYASWQFSWRLLAGEAFLRKYRAADLRGKGDNA